MTRLLCNGVFLDLPEGAGLQFTKKNPMFAFDELSAERTTQFSLPATPTNDAVLGCARVPAYKGKGMRVRFDAQLQDGTTIKNGYLYVTKWSGKAYEAIFVAGMLFNLKSFGNHEWGSLILNNFYDDTLIDADAPSPLVGRVKYQSDLTSSNPAYMQVAPSIDLGWLLTELNTQGVLPISGMDATIVRMIRKQEDYLDEYDELHLEDVEEHLINSAPTQTDMGLSTAQGIIPVDTLLIDNGQTPVYTNCFMCEEGWKITFPDNTPDDLCIAVPLFDSSDYTHVAFLGTRKFLRPATPGGDVQYEGAPLAGQTIELARRFILMTGAGVPYSAVQTIDFAEIDFSQEPAYNVAIRITGRINGTLYTGANRPYNAMLTNLSIGDVLKAYSAVTGLLIGALKDGSIKFISSENFHYIEPDVIEIGEVSRGFNGWAQHNYVAFEESENVLFSERVRVDYPIENQNLEQEKTILLLNAVEGGIYNDNYTDNLLLVRGVEKAFPYSIPENVLAHSSNYTYLNRCTLQKSNALQAICDESTEVKCTCRMTLTEFTQVDSETAFLVNNTRYIWVDASWQKDTAKFTLAKLP